MEEYNRRSNDKYENGVSFNRLNDVPIDDALSHIPTVIQLPIPAHSAPVVAHTEHNDLGARERCFDRYYKLYHWVTGIFVFANIVTYFILFVINMYHKFPKDTHDHIFGSLIASLLAIVALYAFVHICVLGYENMCGRKCQVPLCCGCRWIERHQLRYENREV